jgi:hypothetical protein
MFGLKKPRLRVCFAGSSKYVGVYWNKTKMRFLSYIHLEGKKILVGTFKCDKEASQARNKKLSELGIKV